MINLVISFPDSPTIKHVVRFAQQMELNLSENRHKGDREGWLKSDPWDLLRRLRDEVIELEIAMEHCSTPEEVEREAADIGNFAMMVADTYRDRKEKGIARLYSQD